MEFKSVPGPFTLEGIPVVWHAKPSIPEGPKVMISCPNTGLSLWTGIVMDKGSWRAADIVRNSVTCYHCNETHTWDKKDARLEE